MTIKYLRLLKTAWKSQNKPSHFTHSSSTTKSTQLCLLLPVETKGTQHPKCPSFVPWAKMPNKLFKAGSISAPRRGQPLRLFVTMLTTLWKPSHAVVWDPKPSSLTLWKKRKQTLQRGVTSDPKHPRVALSTHQQEHRERALVQKNSHLTTFLTTASFQVIS